MTVLSGPELRSNLGLASDHLDNLEMAVSPLGAFLSVCFTCSTSEQGLLLVQAAWLLRTQCS